MSFSGNLEIPTSFDNLLEDDQKLLRKEKWIVLSLDRKKSFSIRTFNQEGYFFLCLLKKQDEEEILYVFNIHVSTLEVEYSLELGSKIMGYIHSAAEKDKDGNYIPSKYMYKKMPHISEILFYSNPRNYLKRNCPKYRFGNNNDLVGRFEIGDSAIFSNPNKQEILDMLVFIFGSFVAELNQIHLVMGRSILTSVGNNLLKGAFRGLCYGIKSWFR